MHGKCEKKDEVMMQKRSYKAVKGYKKCREMV